MTPLRVAFFYQSIPTESGPTLLAQHLDVYCRDRAYPLFAAHLGETSQQTADANQVRMELERSRMTVRLGRDWQFDLLHVRFRRRLREALQQFRPDLIHINGPDDSGWLGRHLARQLRLPMVAYWHTNLHELAAAQAEQRLQWLGPETRTGWGRQIRKLCLARLVRFYQGADHILAPNPEMAELLRRITGKPADLLMQGVDTGLFREAKHRKAQGDEFLLGYAGRLEPERKVRLLATLERTLAAAGRRKFRFLIIGEGSERPWLEAHMQRASFLGSLSGKALAEAYARMDVFIFPSEKNYYGHVVQEAMASGVPAIVSAGGGPKFLVQSMVNGFIVADDTGFAPCVMRLMDEPDLLARMRGAARQTACRASWPRVFDQLYATYADVLQHAAGPVAPSMALARH